jgi:hypothetical protein
MTIHIENSGAGIYQVTVEGASTTVHSVTVTPEYLQKLTGGHASAETLIQKSFEFLLERESPTSILRAFSRIRTHHHRRAARTLTNEYRYQHARSHQDGR